MNEERIHYGEIRESFLGYYYICCRNKVDLISKHGDTWSENESEVGYSYYQWENAYDLPIENLMLEVFALIMMAGRGPEQAEKYHRDIITDILSKHSLDELMQEISGDEKEDLLYDMTLLGLVEKKSS